MARPRFRRLAPERQEAILRVAGLEFASEGYEGASLNRILTKAGLSKGVFYYYFDDKADLAATVLTHVLEPMIEPMRTFAAARSRADFWDGMADLARSSLAGIAACPELSGVVSRLGVAMLRHSHLAAHLEPLMQDATAVAAAVWRRGQEAGAVRDNLPAEVLTSVLQAVKEALVRVLVPTDRAPTVAELDRFVELQMDLFRRLAVRAPARRAGAAALRRGGEHDEPLRPTRRRVRS